MSDEYNKCKDCDTEFDNSFELVDHLLDEDYEFDPSLLLPSGARLKIGTLLRFMYQHKDNPEQIALITQKTYITLFAFEYGYSNTQELIEDMVVDSSMVNFDSSLKSLLDGDDCE